MKLGERLKAIRGKVSQAEFAEKLGVSQITVSRWERGARLLDSDNLLKILEIYPWIDLVWLVSGSGEMERRDFQAQSFEQNELNKSFLVNTQIIDHYLESDHYKDIPSKNRGLIYAKFHDHVKSGNSWNHFIIASIISEFYKPSFALHDYDITSKIRTLVDTKHKDLKSDAEKNVKYWEIFDEIDQRFCFFRAIAPNEVKKEIISWIDSQITEAKEAR